MHIHLWNLPICFLCFSVTVPMMAQWTLTLVEDFVHLHTRPQQECLTHVHLLPSFHFAGVDDIKRNWKFFGKEIFLFIKGDECELATFPPGSDMQQAAVVAIQEEDPFNWGYDSVLWKVPKGSYASDFIRKEMQTRGREPPPSSV
ncbi:hypothetical protein ACQJBY_063056 [Aegilops geniculata]